MPLDGQTSGATVRRRLLLIVIYLSFNVFYILFGGTVMYFLEHDYEVRHLKEMTDYVAQVGLSLNQSDHLEELGVCTFPNHLAPHWSFTGSCFYAFTVITTIGYGQFAPVTKTGRSFTSAYAIPGIAVVAVTLSNIASLIAETLEALIGRATHSKVTYGAVPLLVEMDPEGKGGVPLASFRSLIAAMLQATPDPLLMDTISERLAKNAQRVGPGGGEALLDEDGVPLMSYDLVLRGVAMWFRAQADVPAAHKATFKYLGITTGVCMLWILVWALIFAAIESWTFLEGCWFAFVTLSTIGFGDYSPNTKFGRLMGFVFMTPGLGLMAAFFGVLGSMFIRGRYKMSTTWKMSDKMFEAQGFRTDRDLLPSQYSYDALAWSEEDHSAAVKAAARATKPLLKHPAKPILHGELDSFTDKGASLRSQQAASLVGVPPVTATYSPQHQQQQKTTTTTPRRGNLSPVLRPSTHSPHADALSHPLLDQHQTVHVQQLPVSPTGRDVSFRTSASFKPSQQQSQQQQQPQPQSLGRRGSSLRSSGSARRLRQHASPPPRIATHPDEHEPMPAAAAAGHPGGTCPSCNASVLVVDRLRKRERVTCGVCGLRAGGSDAGSALLRCRGAACGYAECAACAGVAGRVDAAPAFGSLNNSPPHQRGNSPGSPTSSVGSSELVTLGMSTGLHSGAGGGGGGGGGASLPGSRSHPRSSLKEHLLQDMADIVVGLSDADPNSPTGENLAASFSDHRRRWPGGGGGGGSELSKSYTEVLPGRGSPVGGGGGGRRSPSAAKGAGGGGGGGGGSNRSPKRGQKSGLHYS